MKEVRERLMEELKTLERELRVDLPKEIKAAVAMGDLRENAEYQAALERQGYVKARIGQLRKRLADLTSINPEQVPRDQVGIGSTVTLKDLDRGREVRYELVLPEAADHAKGLLSISSPIARALLGRRAGETVEVATPAGPRRFEILGLATLHDAAEPGGSGNGG